MKNKNSIEKIEETFLSYLLDNLTEDEFKNRIATSLRVKWQRQFNITIVDNTSREIEPFFGMRIFPSTEVLDNLMRDIEIIVPSFLTILSRWRKISYWNIEFDSRLFDKSRITFNQKELTAMLLHEIAHTIYSGNALEVFYHAYQECRLKRTVSTKACAKAFYFLYTVPLSLACGLRNWKLKGNELREEFYADENVQKEGYGEHLLSAFEKIIKAYGSSNSSNYRNEIDTVKQSILWCDKNISDLEQRQAHLKDELYNTGASTSSSSIKKTINSIMGKLGLKRKERYSGSIATESGLSLQDYDDKQSFVDKNELVYDIATLSKLQQYRHSLQQGMEQSIAQEAFGHRKKDDIPSQLDVDTIFVEVDRISNHADRRYVLDLIYNQEEKIERFKELFEYNSSLKRKYSGKMESMLRELESMRQAVLNKRSFDKNYRVFVKYPAGYEG